jgi:hypothetical protein
MKQPLLTLLFSSFAIFSSFAQNPFQSLVQKTNNAEGNTIAKATEFSIPASPAFDLLGVNPSQITKPTNIREFKVDWSFRSWRLKPNLALQAQPIWEIFYNKSDLNKYRRATPFMRTLSTLDFSAGTVEGDDQQRRASFSTKINLYRAKDPLLDRKLFLEIDTSYRKIQQERLNVIFPLREQLKKAKSNEKKLLIEQKIDSVENHYAQLDAEQKVRIQNISQQFIKDNWNASHIDLAYGRVLNYNNVSLDSLNLTGKLDAIWLNASKGIGKKILVTGLVRYSIQKDTLQENIQKISIPNQADSMLIGNIKNIRGGIFTVGVSFRYGSPKFSFFVEGVYSKGNRNIAIINPEFNLNKLSFYSISYGGDWRISRNVTLSYGVRTDYNQQFKFKNIIPVASIACMMR